MSPGSPPLLLDLGTGVRIYGETLADTVARSRAWPSSATCTGTTCRDCRFFVPVLQPGSRAGDRLGPAGLRAVPRRGVRRRHLRPPFFPVSLRRPGRPGLLHETALDERFTVGERHGDGLRRSPHRTHRGLPHRLAGSCRSAYIPDHQQPALARSTWRPSVLAALTGVDLLDPRRAVHPRGVRGEGRLGSLDPRLRRRGGPPGAGRERWRPVPPRPHARRRRRSTGWCATCAASSAATASR